MEVCAECGEVPQGPICSIGRNAGRPHRLITTAAAKSMGPLAKTPNTSPRTMSRSPQRGGSPRGSVKQPVSPKMLRPRETSPRYHDPVSRPATSPHRLSSLLPSKSIGGTADWHPRHPTSFESQQVEDDMAGWRRSYGSGVSPSMRSYNSRGENDGAARSVAPPKIWPGATVERNPAYWSGGDQDGGAGQKGVVTKVGMSTGWVSVKWNATGVEATHRWGAEGAYDVSIVTPPEARSAWMARDDPSQYTRYPTSPRFGRDAAPDPEQNKVYCRVKVEGLRSPRRLHYKLLPSSRFQQLHTELFSQLSELAPSEWTLLWERDDGRRVHLSLSQTPMELGMEAGLSNLQELTLSPITTAPVPEERGTTHLPSSPVAGSPQAAADEPLRPIPAREVMSARAGVDAPPVRQTSPPLPLEMPLAHPPKNTSPPRKQEGFDPLRAAYAMAGQRETPCLPSRNTRYDVHGAKALCVPPPTDHSVLSADMQQVTKLEEENRQLKKQLEMLTQERERTSRPNIAAEAASVVAEVQATSPPARDGYRRLQCIPAPASPSAAAPPMSNIPRPTLPYSASQPHSHSHSHSHSHPHSHQHTAGERISPQRWSTPGSPSVWNVSSPTAKRPPQQISPVWLRYQQHDVCAPAMYQDITARAPSEVQQVHTTQTTTATTAKQRKALPIDPLQNQQAFIRLKELFQSYLSYGLQMPVGEVERMLHYLKACGVEQLGLPMQTLEVIVMRSMGDLRRPPLSFEEFADTLNLISTVLFPHDHCPMHVVLPRLCPPP